MFSKYKERFVSNKQINLMNIIESRQTNVSRLLEHLIVLRKEITSRQFNQES